MSQTPGQRPDPDDTPPPPAGFPPPPPPGGSTGYPPPGEQPSYGTPPSPYGPPSSGQPSYGQPSYGQPSYGPPGDGQGFGGMPPVSAAGYGSGQVAGIGDALSYGWGKFTQHVGTILLAALAYVLAFVLVFGVWFAILSALGLGLDAAVPRDEFGNPAGGGAAAGMFSGGFVLSSALFGLVALVLGYLVQAGIVRGALHITYGRPLELGTFFRFDRLGTVVLASVLIAIAGSLASAVTFFIGGLGSLVVSLYALFVLPYVLDKGLGVIDAIKASALLVQRNLGTCVVLFLVSVVAYVVGTLLCGVGLLVAIPVVAIATTWTYRRLLGEPVAP